MQNIEYKIVYKEGDEERVTVRARNINSGFTKATRRAQEPLGNGRRREISRIEFWQVIA